MTRARDVANLIGSGNYSSTTFTATAGQTAFTISHTQGFVQVFMNGLLLDETVDYTSNGSAVTLTSGAAAGDEIEVVAYNTFSVGDALNQAAADTRYVNTAGDTMTGNLEINTSASDAGVELVLDGNKTSNGGIGSIIFNNNNDSVGMIRSNRASANDAADMLFYTQATGGANTERMRITNDGLLVGTTDANPGNNSGGSDVGAVLDLNGKILGTANAAEVMVLNRQSSFGRIAEFRKDGGVMGAIGSGFGAELFIAAAGTNSSGLLMTESNSVRPMKDGSASDNTQDLGVGNGRWDDIFATNGSIQTSDENEKQNIASLTSAEITAATAISKLFKTFKWKDKVSAKGDNARTHSGVIAQQVQTAMSDAGLDASKYAFWCSDTWTNDDGNEQTRLGVRYPELLAFVGAATEQRLTSIEARLTTLEGG